MPIYEFFCKKCNTVYKFYSRTVNTETIPKCPKCKRVKLERIFSSFATLSGAKEGGEAETPDIDESKLEKAMSMLEREVDRVDEDDPKQTAELMRKLTDATGMSMGPGMEEALSRLESGEDPETIEQEMGDLLEDESMLFAKKKKKGAKHKPTYPKTDDTLYELD